MSAPQKLALLDATLIDPVAGTQTRGGVLIENGVIRDVGASVTRANIGSGAELIECKGDVVCPGLIDMRASEHRETIATISRAALAGGVTSVCVAPDSSPVRDTTELVDFFVRRARDNDSVRLYSIAALTKGLAGKEIGEIGLLTRAGAIGFGNGRTSVRDAQVMRRAMTYAGDFDALVMHVLQDPDLAATGVMNEGEFATRLGLTGIPREAEVIMLDRDLRLVAMTGARYHAELISTTLSLDAMVKARANGLKVSCGVSINHLTLNENDIGDYRTFLKLMPPLRHEDERLALVEGLASGAIDVIVSDHCGQDVEDKRVPFAEAEAGAVGLETMLSAALRLVQSEQITLPKLIRAMTSRPAEILGLPQGRLSKGAPADLICFDPDEPFVVDPSKLHSQCRNTPFDDARLQGVVKLVIVAGKVLHG